MAWPASSAPRSARAASSRRPADISPPALPAVATSKARRAACCSRRTSPTRTCCLAGAGGRGPSPGPGLGVTVERRRRCARIGRVARSRGSRARRRCRVSAVNRHARFSSLLRLWLKFSAADRFDDATWQPLSGSASEAAGDRAPQPRHGLRQAPRLRARPLRRGLSARRSRQHLRDARAPTSSACCDGEPNVLTAERPLMFATTSGTTGRAKYIPVTPSYLQRVQPRRSTSTPTACSPTSRTCSKGKRSSRRAATWRATRRRHPYGAISGLPDPHPAELRSSRFYVLPYEICKIKQVDAKYYLTLRHALAGRRAADRHAEPVQPAAARREDDSLCRRADLRHSARHASIPTSCRTTRRPRLGARLRADPAARRRASGDPAPHRAAAADATSGPTCGVISCWKGGTMPLYLRRLPELFGEMPGARPRLHGERGPRRARRSSTPAPAAC